MFDLLSGPAAADVLAESDTVTMQAIAADVDNEALSDIVVEMDPDDAADLLSDLPDEEAVEVLGHLDSEEAEEVLGLMAHEEDTGGGIMTPDFIVAHDAASVSEVVDTMRREAEDADIFDIYVVDPENRLVGILPVNRLVTARPQAPVSGLMKREFHSVVVETDQEDIAQLFTRYDQLALPVVDSDGRLVGQITIDDVIDVIHEEATEDIYKMAGTSSDQEIESPSILGVARARLPWLLICLAGSFSPEWSSTCST
jgi:magnesium transporter